MSGASIGRLKVQRDRRDDPAIKSLQDKLARLAPQIAPPVSGFALLDFPDYANVGDSLIWLGELEFFRKNFGRAPSYVCSIAEYDPVALAKAVPTGPIYLSGGGNFGDVWPKFQAFRLKVFADFPDRRIIQLPQTIRFEGGEYLEKTRAAIAGLENFTMMVRDEPSREFVAREFACPVILAPDMAFCLGALRLPGAVKTADIVYLLRTDIEASGARGERGEPEGLKVRQVDWILEEHSQTPWARIMRRYRRIQRQPGTAKANDLLCLQALQQLDRGAALLCAGRAVVTDRLHGHILSILLGLDHAVIDNAYGKVGNFRALWTAADSRAQLASSIDEATALIKARLDQGAAAKT